MIFWVHLNHFYVEQKKISIIGGAGHVGYPLGLIFSSKGFQVTLIDKDKKIQKN